MFSPSQVKWGGSQIDIPMTRDTYQSWSDLKKDIRQKVNSKVKGFENQSFIKKSDLLYNFKEENKFLKKGSPLARTSSTYIKNSIENKFPRESPIKQGLTRSIYSPPKSIFDALSNKKPPMYFKKSESFASQFKKDKPTNNSFDLVRRNKDLNERVTLSSFCIDYAILFLEVMQFQRIEFLLEYLQLRSGLTSEDKLLRLPINILQSLSSLFRINESLMRYLNFLGQRLHDPWMLQSISWSQPELRLPDKALGQEIEKILILRFQKILQFFWTF